MKTKIITAVVIVLFASLAIYSYTTQESKLHIQQVELQKLNIDKKVLESESVKRKRTIDKLNSRIEELHKSGNEDKSKIDELNKQLDNAMQQLQAKAEEKNRLAKASTDVINVATNTRVASASSITGDKHTWLAQSGIPQNEWQYVDYIVSKESGWRPCSYYPSQNNCGASPTTACGLAQSLPCGKQSVYGHWTDPVANLKWMNDYVKKYGGWAGAYAFWVANSWY